MKSSLFNRQRSVLDFLWDCWCVASIVGIWPRFIEPNLIQNTKISLKIPSLSQALSGLKILHFSDLHLHTEVTEFFLNRVIQKVHQIAPDLIVFTGDFLCFSHLQEKERLKNFLKNFSAPYGCYAVLGNHDYEQPVSVNSQGEYDVVSTSPSVLSKGFSRLLSDTKLAKQVTPAARAVGLHQELIDLLKDTPFQLLNNVCKQIKIKNTSLNLCGLGEYMLGKCQPQEAFKSYDPRYPGIILTHNPDSIPLLMDFPGDLILCGHTHGGQINLPWFWKKFTLLENKKYKKGLFHLKNNKWVYVSRGIGGTFPFRWFAIPELGLITLKSSHNG